MIDIVGLLHLLVLNSLWCAGFHVVTRYETHGGEAYKQPLWFVSYLVRKGSGFFAKPVCDCLVCMASLHSLLPFWCYNELSLENIVVYFAYVLALAGANALLESHLP